MTRARGPRYTTLALVILGLACGDAPTASTAAPEVMLVSLTGVAVDGAGIVLELTGDVNAVEPARASLEVAWVRGATNTATVAVVGALTGGDLLVVHRRGGLGPLRVQVREVAAADGAVSSPPSAQAIVRAAPAP